MLSWKRGGSNNYSWARQRGARWTPAAASILLYNDVLPTSHSFLRHGYLICEPTIRADSGSQNERKLVLCWHNGAMNKYCHCVVDMNFILLSDGCIIVSTSSQGVTQSSSSQFLRHLRGEIGPVQPNQNQNLLALWHMVPSVVVTGSMRFSWYVGI